MLAFGIALMISSLVMLLISIDGFNHQVVNFPLVFLAIVCLLLFSIATGIVFGDFEKYIF